MDELCLSPETFQQLLEKMMPWMMSAVGACDTEPATYIADMESSAELEKGRQLADSMKEVDAPVDGRQLPDIMQQLCTVAVRGGPNSGSGGFCGYVPTGGLLHSAAMDLLSACINRTSGMFIANPGVIQLEVNVLRWMARVLGYDPDRAFGSFTTGGSMANYVGVLAARRQHFADDDDLRLGDIMVTSQTHSCIAKAAMMAGFPRSSLVEVACDETLRMDADDLERQLVAAAATRGKNARKLFIVVASAGTTNTGAVDDLRRLAAVSHRHGAWLHVDGVYGAAFNLTERGRQQLAGLEEADSVAIDLHKSFFLPQATGLLMVRDKRHLRQAFDCGGERPSFLPGLDEGEDNFMELSPDLTRPPYGLRLWFPLQLCGARRWREALDKRLDWTDEVVAELRRMAHLGVELVTPPSLTALTFRCVPPSTSAAAQAGADVGNEADSTPETKQQQQQRLHDLNRRLMLFVIQRGNIFLSPTTLPCGTFVIRMCVLHVRLTRERLLVGVRDIGDGAAEIQRATS